MQVRGKEGENLSLGDLRLRQKRAIYIPFFPQLSRFMEHCLTLEAPTFLTFLCSKALPCDPVWGMSYHIFIRKIVTVILFNSLSAILEIAEAGGSSWKIVRDGNSEMMGMADKVPKSQLCSLLHTQHFLVSCCYLVLVMQEYLHNGNW